MFCQSLPSRPHHDPPIHSSHTRIYHVDENARVASSRRRKHPCFVITGPSSPRKRPTIRPRSIPRPTIRPGCRDGCPQVRQYTRVASSRPRKHPCFVITRPSSLRRRSIPRPTIHAGCRDGCPKVRHPVLGFWVCGGTSLIRDPPPVGPYSSPMPGDLR